MRLACIIIYLKPKYMKSHSILSLNYVRELWTIKLCKVAKILNYGRFAIFASGQHFMLAI